jgi:hypothetical protein
MYTLVAIGDIIRAQNESFMGLASKVAAIHDEITRQKSFWDKTQSASAQSLSDIAASMSKSIQQQPQPAAPTAAGQQSFMTSAAPAATSGFSFTSNKRR